MMVKNKSGKSMSLIVEHSDRARKEIDLDSIIKRAQFEKKRRMSGSKNYEITHRKIQDNVKVK